MTGFPRIARPAPAPTIETDRLRLRPMRLADWPPYRDAMTGTHARHMGGPYPLAIAWGFFCSDVCGWDLTGAGALTVETRTGETVGQVGLNDLPSFPELELGWMTYPGHEGRGYAAEAAAALLDWTLDTVRPETLVSYVGADNPASAAVARRLGGQPDPEAPRPEAADLVFRHRCAEASYGTLTELRRNAHPGNPPR